jgi:branched-chain amino acid transport system permease protein
METTRARWLSTAGGVVVVAALTAYFVGWGGHYHQFVATQFCAFVILALSANLLFGYADQIVIVQAALAGIGAYGFALGIRHGLNPVLAAVVGIAAACVAACIVSLPAIRLAGIFLAIATLAFQYGVSGVLNGWQAVGGQVGLPIQRLRVQGYGPLSSDQFWLLLGVFLALVTTLLCWRLVHGPLGRVLASLRQAPVAALALGTRPFPWRLFVYAISGALAGMAGVLLGGEAAYVSPGSFSADQTILIVMAIIVGGLRSIAGSILGAVIAVLLPQALANTSLSQHEGLVFSAVILVALIVMPEGLIHMPSRLPAPRRNVASLFRRHRLAAGPGDRAADGG